MGIRTDLAVESINFKDSSNYFCEKDGNFELHFAEITPDEKQEKPSGKYVTLYFENIEKIVDFEPLEKQFLKTMNLLNLKPENVLVAGLGNRDITADSIGPKTAEKILATTIERVRDLVDVSTIVGEPITVSADITIIPISKVTYGFASGGSDFPSRNNVELFGGGGGAGITINPVAFLVVNKGEVTIKHITASDNAAERAVNLIPEMFDKVTNFVDNRKKATVVEEEPQPIVETE